MSKSKVQMPNEIQSSKSKMSLIFIWHLGFVIWIFVASPASAGNTAVYPAKFAVNGETAKVVSEKITVSNLSNATQHYSFYLEEGSAVGKKISVVPSRFILEPQESITAVVRLRTDHDPWQTNLNLVTYQINQLQSNFRVGDGIKIPVIFMPGQAAGAMVGPTADSHNLLAWNVLVFGIDFILFFVVCYWYYRRHFWWQRRLNHKINFL